MVPEEFEIFHPERSTKSWNYFYEVKPTPFEENVRAAVCSLCACRKQRYKIYKSSSGSALGSHLVNSHAELIKDDELKSKIIDELKTYFKNKVFYFPKKKFTNSQVKKEKKPFFKDWKQLKYIAARWLMESGRPALLVNDPGYRSVLNLR